MKYYLDHNYFFITSRTIEGMKYFSDDKNKKLLSDKILEMQALYDFNYEAFCALDNHYHLFFYLKDGDLLPEIIQRINGGISYLLKDVSKPVWDNYYISNVYNEEAYYKVIGYILGNPWKHGIVSDIKDLGKYQFSNCQQLIEELGIETIGEIIGNIKNLNWELNLIVKKQKY